MKVGAIEIVPVLDGVMATNVPTSKPLTDPAALAWRDQHGTFRADGMIEFPVGGFLVRTGDRLVLVDAGSGQEPAGGYTPPRLDVDADDDELVAYFRRRGLPEDSLRQVAFDLARSELTRGQLPASLAAVGVRPDEVTDVVFTHLHFDHIGWASVGGTLLAGIDVRLAPGHTPGSSVVVVSSGPQRAMLLGDIVHCPLELMDDDFNLLVDYDQELANRVREAYARELDGSEIPVAAPHFPGLRFGRLLPGAAVRHWVFDTE
jgi:glyoxylase-like metal-dependent hydrolase (beta-lactamase superfamily II)